MGIPSKPQFIQLTGRKTGTVYTVSSVDELRDLLSAGELDGTGFSMEDFPAKPYQPQWEHDFPKTGYTIPLSGLESTEPFCIVYKDVTVAMRNYYASNKRSRLFLEKMIESFFDEYLKWADEDGFAHKYLDEWHAVSKGKAYRLVGQAYLHIAWDLPRVVLDCFPLGVNEPLRISEAEAQEHFVGTNKIFREVFEANFKKYKVAGAFAAVGVIAGSRAELQRILLYWILAIRQTAFILGCSLARQTPTRRKELLRQLEASVLYQAREAKGSPWNMVSWMGMINPPSFMFSFVPLIFLFKYQALVGVIVALFLLPVFYEYGLYRGTRKIAREFGRGLEIALEEVLRSARLTEIRSDFERR
jgi:hypothetical protein